MAVKLLSVSRNIWTFLEKGERQVNNKYSGGRTDSYNPPQTLCRKTCATYVWKGEGLSANRSLQSTVKKI